jgi:hypothetical protein
MSGIFDHLPPDALDPQPDSNNWYYLRRYLERQIAKVLDEPCGCEGVRVDFGPHGRERRTFQKTVRSCYKCTNERIAAALLAAAEYPNWCAATHGHGRDIDRALSAGLDALKGDA